MSTVTPIIILGNVISIRQRSFILGQAVTRSRQKGYQVHCGRWLVEGNPQVILFDVGSASHKMAEFKHELYEKAGIGIPHEDTETNDCAILGCVEMKLWLFIFII